MKCGCRWDSFSGIHYCEKHLQERGAHHAYPKKECGCWWEPASGMCFSFKEAKPMPERTAFTDNAIALYHYCEKHWQERQHQEGSA